MTKHLLPLISLGTLLFASLDSWAAPDANSLNIQYHPGKTATDYGMCNGIPERIPGLLGAGIKPSDLERGVRCLVADFDGNGSPDFAIFSVPEVYHGGQVIVMITKAKGRQLLRSVIMSHSFYNAPNIYESKSRKEHSKHFEMQRKFGCPQLKLDGIVQWGEGGTTKVFRYDPKRGDFVKAGECRSESS